MQEIFRSQFRLPAELADKIRESSEASGRSMNAEVVARLEQSFQSKPRNDEDMAELASQLARRLAEEGYQLAALKLDADRKDGDVKKKPSRR